MEGEEEVGAEMDSIADYMRLVALAAVDGQPRQPSMQSNQAEP